MKANSLPAHTLRMMPEGCWNSGPTCVEFLYFLMLVFFKSLFQRCHGEIISRVLWLLLVCYQWQLSPKWAKYDGKCQRENKCFHTSVVCLWLQRAWVEVILLMCLDKALIQMFRKVLCLVFSWPNGQGTFHNLMACIISSSEFASHPWMIVETWVNHQHWLDIWHLLSLGLGQSEYPSLFLHPFIVGPFWREEGYIRLCMH